MNRFYGKVLLLIAIFIVSSLAITIDLKAHKAGNTFQSWAAAAPTIDGNIGVDEWKYAYTRDIDLGGGYDGTLYVMNDAANLYLAVEVNDDNFNTDPWPNTDQFQIIFDNDNNGVSPESGDDILIVRSDGFMDETISGALLDLDTAFGGTQDGAGAIASDGGGNNLIEIAHPLNSDDDAYDFSLTAGSTVGFAIQYYDGDGYGNTDVWPGLTGDQFGDIVVASAPPALSAYTASAPTIDGTIDTGTEWADATTESIVFGWTYSGTLYVMNDDDNLYIAAKISDVDLTGSDFLVILFDNNNNSVGMEDGEDHLQLLSSSTFSDNFFQSASIVTDTGDGGTNDGNAVASGDGSFNYYEFQHPLDSADDAHDFSLSTGSTVGFMLEYRDATTSYWGDWPSTSAASWAKITIASGPDFSITADPNLISVAKGLTGSSTISINSESGFSDPVSLSHSWFGDAPSDVTVNLPDSVTPPSDDSSNATLQISPGAAANTGNFTLRLTGVSGALSHTLDVGVEILETTTTTTGTTTETTETTTTPTTTPTTTETTTTTEATTETTETSPTVTPVVPGCIIASAAYGSEVADEVQFLRTFRDDRVMGTLAGTGFMKAFNAFYYSFSPSVAKFISGSPELKSITRVSLYPLIGSLYLSSFVFDPLSFAPELAVVATGLIVSILLGLVYVFPLAMVSLLALRRRGYKVKVYWVKWLFPAAIVGLLAIVVAEVTGLMGMAMFGSSLFVTSIIAASGTVLATKTLQHL